MSQLLTKYLIDERGVREDKVQSMLAKARESGEHLDTALVESGILTELEMLEFFASQLGLTLEKDLTKYKPNARFAERVPVNFARNYNLVALDETRGSMRVAICRPNWRACCASRLSRCWRRAAKSAS